MCLQSACFWNDPLFSSDCHSILGLILCARIPLSYSVIDALLALPQCRPSGAISCLRSVLCINETEGIRILHPLFHNHLSEWCSGEHWSINLELHNKEVALHCINFLDNELQENICGMTLPNLTQKETLPVLGQHQNPTPWITCGLYKGTQWF